MFIESFAGSAAILIVAASYGKASRVYLNNIKKPWMALWKEIINDPQDIAASYKRIRHTKDFTKVETLNIIRE